MSWIENVFRRRESRSDPAGHIRPEWMTSDMDVTLYDGTVDLEVVGESYYQPSLWMIVGGVSDERIREMCIAVLAADVDNEFDANAISVWVLGNKVGHLSRGDAAKLRPGLLNLHQTTGKPVALSGVVAGGGERADGRGMLGVFLYYDPEDFGLPPIFVETRPPRVRGGAMRTGLSQAIATDAEDDTYDLSWLETVSTDGMTAIKQLRSLLDSEDDPIDRHYMMSELEHRLYRSREAFTSALDDYDAVCLQHDEEMDQIARSFLDKWREIPLLEMYKQQAIRQQKAGNFDEGLWWATRGIEIYGGKAAREEWVDDLKKRADKFSTKLGTP